MRGVHFLPAHPAGPTPPPKLAPGPRGVPLLGNLPAYFSRGFYRLVMDAWQKYGSPFRLRLGPMHLTFISKMGDIKHILAIHQEGYSKGKGYDDYRIGLGCGIVTLDGTEWLARRKLLQPFFTEQAVRQYAPLMTEAAAEVATRWQSFAKTGQGVDVLQEMQRLSLSIILRAVFSRETGIDVAQMERDFQIVLLYLSDLSSGLGVIRKLLPTPARRRFGHAKGRLDALILRQIDERRAEPHRPPDVLTRLIEARDDAFVDGLSNQEILAEIMTIVFAGSETTALVLTWAWYFLATYPTIEKQLHHELERVLGGQLPTVSDLQALLYTANVFKEALRFKPPVWLFPREARHADTLSGCTLPPGEIAMICPHLIQHDPALWLEPEEFQPDRFLPDRASSIAPYSFIPFGAGKRTCLGMVFACQEGVLVLATLAQRYSLRVPPGFCPQPRAAGTLGLATGMSMSVSLRSSHPIAEPEGMATLMYATTDHEEAREGNSMRHHTQRWWARWSAWLACWALTGRPMSQVKPFGPARWAMTRLEEIDEAR